MEWRLHITADKREIKYSVIIKQKYLQKTNENEIQKCKGCAVQTKQERAK